MSDPFSFGSGKKAHAHRSYVNNLRAAEGGDGTAMKDLGVMFATGDGVPNDYDEARRWFEKAAAAGNDDSMVHLAVLHANGWGVPRGYAEARRWLEKSADLGNDGALFRLGELYRKGLGVSPDLGEARRYYEEAAAAGNEDAKKALEGLKQPRAHETQSEETQLAWFESSASQYGGLCSLPGCPCPGDGVEIPVGQGYLYIPRSCCEFRWDCRSMDELATKVERLQQNSQYVWIPGHGVVAPILVCELGAKKLGIDLAVAAKDARHWWATSQVPFRPTPHAGEREIPFTKSGTTSQAEQSGGCFIATAACGSALEPEVDTLRVFRDRVLRKRELGRLFIRIYEQVSPPIARWIARHRVARFLVRRVVVSPCAAIALRVSRNQ